MRKFLVIGLVVLCLAATAPTSPKALVAKQKYDAACQTAKTAYAKALAAADADYLKGLDGALKDAMAQGPAGLDEATQIQAMEKDIAAAAQQRQADLRGDVTYRCWLFSWGGGGHKTVWMFKDSTIIADSGDRGKAAYSDKQIVFHWTNAGGSWDEVFTTADDSNTMHGHNGNAPLDAKLLGTNLVADTPKPPLAGSH